MKVNGSFSRSSSARSSRKSAVLPKSSYSSPTPGSAPRSPRLGEHHYHAAPKSPIYAEQKSPSYPRSPLLERGTKSPKVQLCSPSRAERIFDFNQGACPKSPILPPKSPRSPRSFNYEEVQKEATASSSEQYNFDLQSPPKSKLSKAFHRQQYQASKSDSSNSKSSLEYHSTTTHPTGEYQDIEYKICHSLDSESTKSETQTCSSYRYSSRHSSFKEKSKKPKCNIRTNPGYDERYSSSKSINESERAERPIQRCRKSTSDLTDMTDDAANTTMTSLSRPSSPRRKGSVKGGLAYLASRRGSRDSVASNMSNVSNEDIGPLNFQNTARGRQRRTSNFLELPVPDHIRPRVCSLPEKAYNPRLSDDLYRLRTFSITNKGGVVNCGDSIINRRSRSNTSVNSTASKASNVSGERSPFDGSCCGSGYHTVDSTPLGSPEEMEVPKYRVVMLGDAGVGKTALVSQFMTSEYMNTYDASLDDEFGERTVSVLLDGEESEMIFIDHPASEMSVENSLSTYEPHACVVVYSVVARASFQHTEETLNYLWREGYTQEKSVIVVGNKADLARSRVITSNGTFITPASKIWSLQPQFLAVIAINSVRCPSSHAKASGTGDRYTRELTTVMFPEMPQSDDASVVPDIPKTDPCYRFKFEGMDKHEFYSPGFEDKPNYTNNTNCVRVLEAPEGHIIKLDFRDYFEIEQSNNCEHDFLEVRNGQHGYNDRIERKFCGNDFPPMIQSSDRYLWIHFKSDENIEYRGFRAVFEFVPRPSGWSVPDIPMCRLDKTLQEEGNISKIDIPPNITEFRHKYKVATDCIWAITVKPNQRIQLQFKKFDLDKPNECDKNFVQIFSTHTDLNSMEKQFCGSIADTVLSKKNVMFVRFFAVYNSTVNSNFEANFTAYRDIDKQSKGEKDGCNKDEFNCEDATCISETLRCNGRYNCRFRWDEDNCQACVSPSFTTASRN
ncbi:uncharacterized protein [Tenebrio molitor]|uniref:uncharacterized protein isoform X4 n=1 Tax=Tenebrio molitor TaxID=7067 RepID=UPI00362484AC